MFPELQMLITGTLLQNNLPSSGLLNFLLGRLFQRGKFDEWFQIDSDSQKDEAVHQLHKLQAFPAA